MAANEAPPTKYAVALFPGFQALDVFGPVDMLNLLSKTYLMRLSVLGPTLDPVSTLTPEAEASGTRIGQRVTPTHTYGSAPEDIEVLLVPGGMGTRDLEATQVVADFVKDRFPKLRYLLTVCTGSALVARTGVLDGKRATSNKLSFEWVKTQGPNVDWVRKARWVEEGSVWTSSGVSAGMDMILAFLAKQHGDAVADDVSTQSEYIRNKDPNNDPFA